MTSLYKILIPGSNAEVYAKMENENPTGTHKDRSMGPWIDHYAQQGKKKFVLSSSGNSAFAAARHCDEMGLELSIFMHPSDRGEKLAKIKKYKNVSVELTKTPKKDALHFAKKHNVPLLRASTDDHALEGYKKIAFELIEQLSKIDNIFVPTSSGATLEGIYLGFKEKTRRAPALYAVQTSRVHPISDYFDKDFKPEGVSYAHAIVDNIAHRKKRIVRIAQETGGGGFVIQNKEIEEAKKIISGGYQSALAFAGFLKWKSQNSKKAEKETSVCLFTD